MKRLQWVLASSAFLLCTKGFGGNGTLPFGHGTLPFGMVGEVVDGDQPIEVVFDEGTRVDIDFTNSSPDRPIVTDGPVNTEEGNLASAARCPRGMDSYQVGGSIAMGPETYKVTLVCASDDPRAGKERIVFAKDGRSTMKLDGYLESGPRGSEIFSGQMTVDGDIYGFSLQ